MFFLLPIERMEVNIIDLNKEKREPFVSSEMVGGISMGKLRK
jgi:hypothetical protein